MAALTVRNAMDNRIERLTQRRQHALAQVQELGDLIASLRSERDAFTPSVEALLARLQDLSVIKAED